MAVHREVAVAATVAMGVTTMAAAVALVAMVAREAITGGGGGAILGTTGGIGGSSPIDAVTISPYTFSGLSCISLCRRWGRLW